MKGFMNNEVKKIDLGNNLKKKKYEKSMVNVPINALLRWRKHGTRQKSR